MATTPVGTIYPRARGQEVQTLNDVVVDLIEAIVQCDFCAGEFPKNEPPEVQLKYVWSRVQDYATKVVKYVDEAYK